MTHAHEASRSDALVVIPTYNEAESLEPLVLETLEAAPSAVVLIVDDNSPDGTGEIGARMAEALDEVHVLHRPTKQGAASAYAHGIRWARDRGYPTVLRWPRLREKLSRSGNSRV